MRNLSTDQLLIELGLLNSSTKCWLDDSYGIANLVRKSVFRRGAATRREVWQDWQVALASAGLESLKIKDAILKICDRLEALRDFVPVGIGREHGWIKAEPRWIKLNDNQGVLIGAVPPAIEKKVVSANNINREDLVRRFEIEKVERHVLEECEPFSMNEWLGPPEWNQFVEMVTDDEKVGLLEFWAIQKDRLSNSYLTSDDDNAITFLCSSSGSFFGSFRSGTPTGRWQKVSDASDGIFVGVRKGFNDNDWRYFLCEVTDRRIKNVVGLQNYNELSWTLLAKGIATICDEKWSVEDQVVSFSFPPPKQVVKLCDLFGWRVGPWKWRLCSDFEKDELAYWNR